MLRFLEKCASTFWDLINRIFALISPFGRGREFFRLGPGLRAFLHILVLGCVLGGLWWLNRFLSLDTAIIPPSFAPWMRYFWLDILFLLLYAMTWLGWWLWKLLGPEDAGSDFPDIDDAWEEALKALSDNQIELTDAPLFLVLGKSHGGDEALFSAAQLSLTVKQTPRAASAPLHVYANRDGIYLTAPGACLMGKQAALLTGEDEGGGESSGGGDSDGTPEEDMFKTLQPKGKMKDMQAIFARAREQGRSPEQLTEEEKGEIKLLMAEEEAERGGGAARKPAASLVKNASEVERLSARLKYLCRLIVRDRRPFCPINGIMVLVPFAGAEREEDATNTGTLLQQDLMNVRHVLQVNCPVLAMICDLETAPGFREFIERFPADQRQRRLGQRFPLVPDLEPAGVPGMIDGGVGWIAQAMFPNWVYKLFRLEGGGGAKSDLATVVSGNARLYQLLGAIRERQKRLGRILVRGAIGENSLPLFAGIYVAGTGREAAREQAFVAGVFRRLIENQNFVSWTDEAITEEADNQRWTSYGYIGLGVAAVALTALAFFFWKAKK